MSTLNVNSLQTAGGISPVLVADIAKKSELVASSGSANVGHLPAGTGAVATTVQAKLRNLVSVKDFGAVGDGVTDDTTAVQTAITYVINNAAAGAKCLIFPSGVYLVSQISFWSASVAVSGATFIFEGSQILGKATGTYSSVVDVMCGFSNFIDMKVNANLNAGYECAVHWYTNNVTQSYPGYMRFINLTVTQALRGLVVGMLPSQSGTYYAGGATVAKPLAIDAPVSESYVEGLQTTFCVEGVRVCQPNGKLTFTNCHIAGDDTSQLTYATSTNPIVVQNGEVTILGGTLELITETAGLFCTFGSYLLGASSIPVGVNVNIVGTIMEAVSPMYILGNTVVRISHDLNWGVNGAKEFVYVDQNAIGELYITDSHLLRGAGTGYPNTVVKGVSNTSGTYAPAYQFTNVFTNVKFGNCYITSATATYQPLSRGVYSRYINSLIAIYNSSSVRTGALWFDTVRNALAGSVDLSASTITAYGVNPGTVSGGWTFAVGGASSWGRYATGLPTILSAPVAQCMRLTAVGGGGTASATSPKFAVEPGRTYFFTGFIKTSVTGANIIIDALAYQFDSVASGTPNVYMAIAQDTQYGATWQPFEFQFTTPTDTTQVSLFLYAENGADMQLFGMRLS